VKLLHAADIHLDSPLRGLERYEGAPVDEMRGATRRALSNLVELCLTEQVELLLLAGDLFDGDWRDYNTGLYFAKQVSRLSAEGVRVVWIRGNHDAASLITRSLRMPDGVVELASEAPQTLRLEELGVAVHGQSYARRDVAEALAARYPEPVPGLFNVGLLHTALDGRSGHDPYAPCSTDRLRSLGYQYWALGHVHNREVVCEDPWIVFPGNLQGRHARETGPKGATLVEVEDAAVRSVEARELDVVRWALCEVDAAQLATLSDVVDQARAAIEAAAAAAGDRTLAVRLRVSGASAAHAALRAERERFRHELEAASFDVGAPVWIEKVELATRSALDLDTLLSQDDPVADLLRSIRELPSDGSELEALARELGALAAKLPPEYRQRDDALDLESPDTVAALLDEVEQDLLPRLLESRDDR